MLLERFDRHSGRWVVVDTFRGDELDRLKGLVVANAASPQPALLRVSPIATAAHR
jgi:hypothetical protein